MLYRRLIRSVCLLALITMLMLTDQGLAAGFGGIQAANFGANSFGASPMKNGYMTVSKVKHKPAAKKTKTEARKQLRAGNKGMAVKKLQQELAERGYLAKGSVSGQYGASTTRAVREFQMMNGLSVSGRATVSTQKKLEDAGNKPGVSMDAWGKSDINRRFPSHGGMATIVDLKTGARIRIRRLYGSNHCDVEPAEKSDTARLKTIYGGKWSWDSRGVLLIAGGKYYAAAINSMPHGEEISKTNGYPGQFCLHLHGSKTHGSGKVNVEHQANIRRVYDYFE